MKRCFPDEVDSPLQHWETNAFGFAAVEISIYRIGFAVALSLTVLIRQPVIKSLSATLFVDRRKPYQTEFLRGQRKTLLEFATAWTAESVREPASNKLEACDCKILCWRNLIRRPRIPNRCDLTRAFLRWIPPCLNEEDVTT
jgi:hypothetical protein